jgi:hypothetical protein
VSKKRHALVWGLVVLATILLLISSFTVWMKRQLLDTDNWTTTSSELLANDQIRGAISQKLVDELFLRINVESQLQQRLPPRAKGAAPILASGLETAAVRAANRLLATPRVQQLWETANRLMHRDLVRVLEGKNVRHITTENGAVVLDLRPIIHRLAEKLGIQDQLAARAPPDAGQIVIVRSDQIETAQHVVRIFRVLTIFLALVALALYVLAIYLAKGRRRIVLEVAGGTLILVGLILVIIRRFAGDAIIDAVVKVQANRPPAHSIWIIATALMGDLALGLVVYGIAFALAAILAGPTRIATWIRRSLAPTYRDRPWVIFSVVTLVFVALVAWAPLGRERQLLGILIAFVLVLLGVEILRRQVLREFPAEADTSSPAPPPPQAA